MNAQKERGGETTYRQCATSSPYSFVGGWINPVALMRSDLGATSLPVTVAYEINRHPLSP